MVSVTVENERREYEVGTLLKDVAAEFQPRFDHDILLAFVNGKLQELHKVVRNGSEIRFLTARNKPGMQTYHRSVLLMCLKAFYEVLGEERLRELSVKFSMGGGLYLESAGDFVPDAALIGQIKAKMQEYVDARLPIMKRNISTDEAVELFRHYKMYDKEKLFHFRRVSRVNIYNLDGFEDYHYGYMVQHTGYLKYFDLVPYQQGMVLLLPDMSEPKRVPVFAPQEKLFQVLKESGEWGRKLHTSNVGSLNERISAGDSDPGSADGKEDGRHR